MCKEHERKRENLKKIGEEGKERETQAWIGQDNLGLPRQSHDREGEDSLDPGLVITP